MTPYEQLRTRINELLPDRLKLDFGCEVMMKPYRGQDMEMVNYSISRPVPIVSTCDGTSGAPRILYIDNFGVTGMDGMKKAKGSDDEWVQAPSRIKEILGKPLTIEDVLRALGMTGNTIYESIVVRGDKLRIVMPDGGTETFLEDKGDQYESGVNYTFIDITVDLTKPLSAPENEAACAAVLELLSHRTGGGD